MTWLVPKLNKRIQVLIPKDDPNIAGGFTRGYDHILTIWAGIEPIERSGGVYIRGVQIDDNITHKFIVRKIAVSELGKSFFSGFSGAFNIQVDKHPVKTEYFIYLVDDILVERSFDNFQFNSSFQNRNILPGRLFRIRRIIDNKEEGEFLKIYTEEIEEQATGYAA